MTVSSRWHVSCRLILWLQVIPWWRNTRWHILEDLSYCIMLMHTWVAWLYNMLNWLTQAILPQIDLWILKMDRGSSAYVQLRVLCSNRNRTRQLQNIYACTGRPMYLWCWNEQACRSHICIVDAPHQREASGCHVCLGKAGPSYINTGPWPPYPCLWGRIIRLNICRANWLPWLLKKAEPLNLNIGPWDTHPSKYGAWICVNDQYLSPYWTTAKWLPRLLRKSRPFIFKYRPLGPASFNIWGMFTNVDV